MAMLKTKAYFVFVLLTLCISLSQAKTPTLSFTQYVNPFIGTDGTGHVFPGASIPFGMVAPSPDNADRGWDYTSGYQYRAPKIMGFSNTHISGAGIGELGDVLLQPASGTGWTAATTDFAGRYDKKSEAAQPGYYKVSVPAHGVKIELTATQRVALHRYTFNRGGKVQVLADLQHGILFNESPRVTQSDVKTDAAMGEIVGTVHTKQWVERQASFVVRFSQPIDRVETLPSKEWAKAPRYLLTFDLKRGRLLEARVALSTVDVGGARRNLMEAERRNFDQVRADANKTWNELLARVEIYAPINQKRIFYSALYRTLLHPSDIADIDGRVRGPTGEIITARGGSYYSTLSLWDTFRGVHPLLTILTPERVDGFVLTFLEHHKAQGYLPLWTAWGRETWTMIGNPALPVIADAAAKGFKGFDHHEALKAMIETSTMPRRNAPPWAQQDWNVYEQFGYLPFDKVDGEAVSKTLEFGIGDDAVARVADMLGQTGVAKRFAARAQGYQKLYDTDSHMMRGRDANGAWRTPFDPLVPTSPLNNPGDYTEANAWQYTLTPALHDPQGLIKLFGGQKALGAWLDQFFSVRALADNKHLGQEALIGQYAHGNEPSHHIAYLYAYSEVPWKGHALLHKIVNDFYSDRPNGIIGNDDCGQMSAWYILTTLGFYPVVPASGEFVFGAPQAQSATIRLPRGKKLDIRAPAFGAPNLYAASALLNGKPVSRTAFKYADLMAGGTLTFAMQTMPN
jgi:predicted alpha-1,2-mannosidase